MLAEELVHVALDDGRLPGAQLADNQDLVQVLPPFRAGRGVGLKQGCEMRIWELRAIGACLNGSRFISRLITKSWINDGFGCVREWHPDNIMR